jgi:hypothetical protein
VKTVAIPTRGENGGYSHRRKRRGRHGRLCRQGRYGSLCIYARGYSSDQ